ncbi:MAG: L-histidine N(alpha)-methyltransferase [Parvularculaceae bacterium]
MTHKQSALRSKTAGFRFVDFLRREESFEEAFLDGMKASPRAIPCRFLYDAQGSALFDRICTLPEYYPTRTELSILEAHASDIAKIIGPGAALIELGSGSSIKTRLLLDRMEAPAAYMPIDVSREHLRAAANGLAGDYPEIDVIAVCADYSAHFPLPAVDGRRVGFFPGSTIGNLTHGEARLLLAGWRERLGADGLMVVGVDLKKDPGRLLAAYDDAEGVTEAFIKNVLARANRELGADFDLSAFRYDVAWNEEAGRIEMRLEALADQSVEVAGERLFIGAGERIHVENSHKYAVAEFSALARRAGFSPRAVYIDPERLFSVHVLAAG